MELTSFRRKLKRSTRLALEGLRPEAGNWFNDWHTHVDWNSDGRISAEHRQAELAALFELHRGVRERMADYRKPFHHYALICQADPGQDAVYLHTANPHTPFPAPIKNVEWPDKLPPWLAPHVDASTCRVAKVRGINGRSVFFVVEDILGPNRWFQATLPLRAGAAEPRR